MIYRWKSVPCQKSGLRSWRTTAIRVFCPGPVQTNILETGNLRPDRYRDSALLQSEKELQSQSTSPNWMTIDEVGERMLAAFPEEPINHTRADEIGFLLHNPIFDLG